MVERRDNGCATVQRENAFVSKKGWQGGSEGWRTCGMFACEGQFAKTIAKPTNDRSWIGPGSWHIFLCLSWNTSYWIIEFQESVAIIPKNCDLEEPESCLWVTLDLPPFFFPQTPLAVLPCFYPCHYKWAPSLWVGVGRMTLIFLTPSPHFIIKVSLLRFLPEISLSLNPQLPPLPSKLGSWLSDCMTL